MSWLLSVALSNALAAAILAVVVLLISRIWRRPALLHCLWVIVLLKLITPPLFSIPIPAEGLGVEPTSVPSPTAGAPVRGELPAPPAAAGDVMAGPTIAMLPDNRAVLELPPAAPVTQPAAAPRAPVAPSANQPSSTAIVTDAALLEWVLIAAWLTGTVVVSLLVTWRVLAFQRVLRRVTPAPPSLQEDADRIARQMGLARVPQVLLVAAPISPMLWGWAGRARILFPLELASQLEPRSRETLLLHELAHYYRGDHWVRWLELVTFCLYWWNPIVWLARRELHQAEEDCCDAWVVTEMPESRPLYARALLQTIGFLSEVRPTLPPVASGIGYFQTVQHRLTRIMTAPASRGLSNLARMVATVVAVIVLPSLPTFSTASAEDKQPPAERKEAPKQANAVVVTGLEPIEFETTPVPFPPLVQNAQGSAFSPDGQSLVTVYGRGNETGEIRIWDVKQRSERLKMAEPKGIRAVAVSPDGQTLAYGTFAGTIVLRSMATGKVEKQWQETAGTVESVAFSADGKSLATSSSAKVARVWDIATGSVTQTLTGHTDIVYGVIILADNATAATAGNDRSVRTWELSSGRMLRQFDLPGPVFALTGSKDGKRIAAGCMDGNARVWNVASGELEATLPGEGAAVSVSFSPEGDVLAVGRGTGTVGLFNLKTSEQLATFTGHQNVVHGVTISADGKLLASTSWDRSVKLWDVTAQRELDTLVPANNVNDDPQSVLALAWSPDRTTVASAHEDRTIRLRDAATGTVQRVLKGHDDVVTALAFAPDGKWLASTGYDGVIKVWDWRAAGENPPVKTLTGHTKWVMSVAFSPDSQRLATGSYDKTLRLWDVAEGKELSQLEGHRAGVRSVAFSPDGRYLATGSSDRTVKVWDAKELRELHVLKDHTDAVRAIAFSPRGTLLATASEDRSIKLWDLTNPTAPRTLAGHSDGVWALAFSPRGDTLASGGSTGPIKLWNPKTGAERATLRGHRDAVSALVFAPDTSAFISGSYDKTLQRWTSKGTPLPTLAALATIPRQSDAMLSATFSPDGQVLAVGEKATVLHDVRTGRVMHTLEGQKSGTTHLAFSPDGRLLAVATYSGLIRLWDVKAGKWLGDLNDHKGRVSRVCFSPDGRLLASAGKDRTLKLWNVEQRKLLATSPEQALLLTGVAFAPDGKTLATSSGDWTTWQTPGEVKLWSVESLKELRTLTGHGEEIKGVVFLPDSKRLVSWSSSSRGTTRIWDVATGMEIGQFAGCHALTLLPDGRRVATGDMKGKLMLWDLEKRQPLLHLEGHTDLMYTLASTPDGSLLASTSRDGSVRLWPTSVGGRTLPDWQAQAPPSPLRPTASSR